MATPPPGQCAMSVGIRKLLKSRSERSTDGRVIRFVFKRDSSPVSFIEAVNRWQNDADFRAFFMHQLLNSPFPVFRWETPATSLATADQPFEFVLIDSPEISLEPDPGPFAQYFEPGESEGVVEFPNLGRDAILIAPCPCDSLPGYGHLASFLRNSPETQQHRLWQLVGAAMQRRISSKPVWLSTAGGGVAWLHVRLDDRPKYYGYAPYRDAA